MQTLTRGAITGHCEGQTSGATKPAVRREGRSLQDHRDSCNQIHHLHLKKNHSVIFLGTFTGRRREQGAERRKEDDPPDPSTSSYLQAEERSSKILGRREPNAQRHC